MKIGLRSLAFVFALVLVTGSPTAGAHQPADYPFAWTYTITNRVFFQGNPNIWPGAAWDARAEDAMGRWNAVSGVPLTFSLGGNADPEDVACGDRDLMEYGDVDGPGGFIGVTIWCSAMNSTVQIVIDSDDNPWYSGAATPNDSNKWDLQGLLTHEFGHATRGWLKCVAPDQNKTKDPCSGMHYDSAHNGLICDKADLSNYSTMCDSMPSKVESWRTRSLETHDKDILQNAY